MILPPYPLFPGYKGEPLHGVLVKVGHLPVQRPVLPSTTPQELRALIRGEQLTHVPDCPCLLHLELRELWVPVDGLMRVSVCGFAVTAATSTARLLAAARVLYHDDGRWEQMPGVIEDWGDWRAFTRPNYQAPVN